MALALPPSALKDIRLLVELDEKRLRVLGDIFASAESLPPFDNGFVRQAAERLQIDQGSAGSIVLACQVLLSWVEQGAEAARVVRELRDFLAATLPSAEQLLKTFDAKRSVLESVLTPKMARMTAQKVRYLTHGLEPTVDSFRTICELRPVFEGPKGQENIVGYASIVALEVRVSTMRGADQTILLHFSPEKLKSLGEMVKRTEEKLETIKRKFGDELLSY